MATKQPDERDKREPVPALTPEQRLIRTLAMPGVIVHERDPRHSSWAFTPWIRVREGYDLNAAIEREQDDDACSVLSP